MANWNIPGDGTWNVAGNWDQVNPATPVFPNAAGAVATFSGASATRSININSTPALTVGILNLSAGGTPNGGYTFTNGVLNLSNGASAAQINVQTANNSADIAASAGLYLISTVAVDVVESAKFTVDGTVNGSGGLTKTNSGTMTLTGTNAYAGTTQINGGTLQIGNGGTTGTLGTANVTNSAALTFNRSNTHTVNNVISGAGNLFNVGTGTTILTGANSYSGITYVSQGTLQIGDGTTSGALGNGTGVVVMSNGANLAFNWSDNHTIANVIQGTGGITKFGTGLTTLTAANNYTGTTTITAGVLEVSNGLALGTGNVLNNSLLSVAGLSNITIANSISGTGGLSTKSGSSTTLTGVNTYAGSTSVGFNSQVSVGNGGLDGAVASGSIVLVTNSKFIYNKSSNDAIANDVTNFGSGGAIFQKLGIGTLIYNGNVNSASIPIDVKIDGGTLQIGNGGTAGSLGTGAITDNAALVFNRSDTVTIANVISGTGTLEQKGTGTTILTGANTYAGTTTISAGTLQIGEGFTTGTLGNGTSAVVDNGTLALNWSDTHTITNVISGTGSLTKRGAGKTILASDNSYSGNTTISAGELQVGNGGSTGLLGSGAIVNNGTLSFNSTTTLSIASAISGSGNLKVYTGTAVYLSGANSYTGTTTVSDSSALLIGAAGTTGTLGSGNVILGANAGLSFRHVSTAVFVNNISGAGTLDKFDHGTTILTGSNTYTGTTSIVVGTLQIGNGGTTGTLGTGAVSVGTTLVFNRSDIATVANAISGAGTLTQAGTGTTILTGANTYAGTTTISAGTLQIGNGGSTGTLGSGAVVDNGALVFNKGTSSATLSNISGTGSLTKLGTGDLSLFGANTYSGTTTVNAGTLNATGGANALSANSAFTVEAGATLYLNGNQSIGSLAGNGMVQGGLGHPIVIVAATLSTGGNNTNSTFTGSLSNGGANATLALTKTGTGTMTLTGANTYTGTTTINAGTLQIGNGGTTGTLGTGAIVDNGALVFNRALSFDFVFNTQPISGSGSVSAIGTQGVIFASVNHTYTGATLIGVGSAISLAGASISQSSNVTVNGFLILTDQTTNTSLVDIAGTGTINLTNHASQVRTLTLTNQDGAFAGTFNGTSGINAIVVNGAAIDFSLVQFTNWTGGSDTINFVGTASANTISGTLVSDIINGGAGADTMIGGLGDDAYVFDDLGDHAIELAGGGIDTVNTSVSYIMEANIENVTLTGINTNDGVLGNVLANIINGNGGNNGIASGDGNDTINAGAGNDVLDGGIGADAMSGGLGSDVYFVDNLGDTVVGETAEVGVYDTVWTTVSFTLPSEVEILILNGGTLAINGTGNAGAGAVNPNLMLGNNAVNVLTTFGGDDIILGLDGNDTISAGGSSVAGYNLIVGGNGNDLMTAGSGHDFFAYSNISEAGDTINSFQTAGGNGLDILDLRIMFGTFTGWGGVGGAAGAEASGHLTFTQSGGDTQVLADADGGANNQVLLATLIGTTAANVRNNTLV
jgi:fibronectin-binding autotransporter adhesin